jgi:hypothetical protein
VEIISILIPSLFVIGGFRASYSCCEPALYGVTEDHASITPLSGNEVSSELLEHGGSDLTLSGQDNSKRSNFRPLTEKLLILSDCILESN